MRSLLALLCPIVCMSLVACSDQPAPVATAANASLAPAPTATDVVVTVAPRVAPEGTTPVVIEATLTGLSKRATVVATFTGDAAYWAQADLAMTARTRDRFTFQGTLTAPTQIGLHALSWRLSASPGGAIGAPITAGLEVTCSDGVFCNGEERYTVRGCVGGPPPCVDGAACTADVCDELTRTCELVPTGNNCSDCDAKNCRPKCGRRQQCGDDGCGGRCLSDATDADGDCLVGSCVEGACREIADAGTCTNPAPLYGTDGVIPPGGADFTVLGDSSLPGFDLVQLSCGGAGIPDRVYRFVVQEKVGLDIRTLSESGDPETLDTVLAVHGADCSTQPPFTGFCSDDAAPPGGYGSRVYGPLDPGTYHLVVSGFTSSQLGPFQAQVKIVPGCVPTCDGKFCGDDGCGGVCGICAVSEECSAATARCVPVGASCEPDCRGRKCGGDGCGGSCGSCDADEVCGETEGTCVTLSGCDHLKPVCKQKCGPKAYCGADCECHAVDEVLVDLAPAPASVLVPSIEFEWRDFSGTSCAIAEGCVRGPGRWLLMRFTTDIINYGLGSFAPGDPTEDPEFFEYHDCHQHFHFSGFANYALKSFDGQTRLVGRKLSYCMEDTYPWLAGPTIACDTKYTCENQGIQAGWVDSYANTLDCQWLVLRGATASPTDIAPGWYIHETCTNEGRYFHESTYDNNCVQIPVYVPEVPDNGVVLKYGDLTLPPMP